MTDWIGTRPLGRENGVTSEPDAHFERRLAWQDLLAAIYDEYGQVTVNVGQALNRYRQAVGDE